MGELTKYSVSFRIRNDNLDTLEITEMLGIKPDKAHRKGDPNTARSKKGKLIEFSPYNTGLWCIDSKEEEFSSLKYHLGSLLSILLPLKNELLELSNKGYKMDLFCGVFTHGTHQCGFNIDADVLFMLGELNIELNICIY
jgi:hypothetical protein